MCSFFPGKRNELRGAVIHLLQHKSLLSPANGGSWSLILAKIVLSDVPHGVIYMQEKWGGENGQGSQRACTNVYRECLVTRELMHT